MQSDMDFSENVRTDQSISFEIGAFEIGASDELSSVRLASGLYERFSRAPPKGRDANTSSEQHASINESHCKRALNGPLEWALPSKSSIGVLQTTR